MRFCWWEADFDLVQVGFSSGGAGQVVSLYNRDAIAIFYNIWCNGVFIQRGDSSCILECDNTEVLFTRSVIWLSISGFSSGGAGQVVSLGNRDGMANFYNIGGIGIFIGWGDSPWVLIYETDEDLLVRSWFWLSGATLSIYENAHKLSSYKINLYSPNCLCKWWISNFIS